MTIVVTVLEFPEGASLSESSMTFGEQGGTFGRTQSNSWILDDPDRFLSGSHCQIIFEGGSYFLVDTSTNGTFVNGSDEPLGKGNKVKLSNGDQYELSDYQFKVQISSNSQVAAAPQTNSQPNPAMNTGEAQPSIFDSDDPFAMPSSPVAPLPASTPATPFSSDPFAAPVSSNELPIKENEEEMDPLAALNKSNQIIEEEKSSVDPFANSYSDNANVANQAIDWPSAPPPSTGSMIPENWDDDLSQDDLAQPFAAPIEPVIPAESQAPAKSVLPEEPIIPAQVVPAQVMSREVETSNKVPEPVSTENHIDSENSDAPSISVSESEARRRALEKENRKIRAEVSKLKKQVMALKKRSSSGADTTLVDAIGFKNQTLDSSKIAEINEISGEFIRHVVDGMMQTLASRNNVKNAFRMNMTTIQPVENNPLKFSANVDDALDNMFLKEGNSYKKPIETVKESFESIADHQVAILAGIRSAFKGVVNRFEPSTLETRFEKQNKRGLLPRNEKARYWDAFNDYYKELFSDIDSSFQYLFGDEFSQAYEEQLQTLSHTRKKVN